MTQPASGWLTNKRSRLSTDNAEKLLILKENLLKFGLMRRKHDVELIVL